MPIVGRSEVTALVFQDDCQKGLIVIIVIVLVALCHSLTIHKNLQQAQQDGGRCDGHLASRFRIDQYQLRRRMRQNVIVHGPSERNPRILLIIIKKE